MENHKKEENNEIYGPYIMRETSTQFYFRKMKREGSYCKENYNISFTFLLNTNIFLFNFTSLYI